MQDPLPTADVSLDAAGEACGTVTPVIKQAAIPSPGEREHPAGGAIPLAPT